MLYLIAASILTLTTLADLENVTEEWIAPGVDISRETLVEFAEHGPMFEGESEPFVGCHVAFVEVNGEEKWRAVVVYTDRVVLFQEDQEPVVTLHNFPVDNLCFSDSGNFIVLHDGCYSYTGRNALRINTETGESLFFDSQPDGLLDKSDFGVWEDGSLVFSRTLDWDTHLYRFYFLDSNLTNIVHFDAQRPYNAILTENLFLFCYSNSLICFNKHGESLWEQILENGSLSKPALSNDNILLLTSSTLELRFLETGELKHTYPLPEIAFGGSAVFLSNGQDWLCNVTTSGSAGFERSLLSGSTNSNFVVSSPDNNTNYSSTIANVSESHLLITSQHRQDMFLNTTHIVTNLQFIPQYAHTRSRQLTLRPSLPTAVTTCKMSNSGSLLLCSTLSEINIVRIGE